MERLENGVIESRVTMGSPAEEKVRLFRRLFRGREDAFALRFLAQRLDPLPETRGRFRCHAKLDIPFEANPDLHVDLLDAGRRLVIELDSEEEALQPDAYRRARRKDLRLQAAGYRVIRFFTGDVSTRLSSILDDILMFGKAGG